MKFTGSRDKSFRFIMDLKKFYLTTAINYTNGPPHFGHAYEAIVGDCLARYHRANGEEVFFLTGADEHGQKVAETAAAHTPPLTPIQLCDQCVEKFKEMNHSLKISYNGYIRTTSPEHETLAKQMWKWVATSEDIYLGTYEGWYSKREERFVTETEAKEMNYMDALVGGQPLTKTGEPSYFFRMSKYQQPLVSYITDHPEFIFPLEKRNEILERLKEPLMDLSISRTSFDWGIPIPDSFDGKEPETKYNHVMYVWFDALTNYLSGIGWPTGGNAKFWPAIHLIGKDIAWFHAVIWPCMLMSAEIMLPKQIVCHGFINGPDDRKMSKSWGNVVDPMETLRKYPSDVIRYFLLREGSFGSDISFNEESLKVRHDAELAANLGNLVSRTFALLQKECNGIIPEETAINIFNIQELADKVEEKMTSFQIHSTVLLIFGKLTEMNEWLTLQAPWRLTDIQTKRSIIRTLLEGLYILSHFLEPFIPDTASKIFGMLGIMPMGKIPILCSSDAWNFLRPGKQLSTSRLSLFPRLGETRFEKKDKR